MSKQLSKLSDDARRLEAVLVDIRSVPSTADWDSPVKCAGTLATGQEVEHWYLVEYFLSSLVNWDARVKRYRRYFGQPPSVIPSEWRTLGEECWEFADHYWSKDTLDERLASAWTQMLDESRSMNDHRDAAGLYHEIISSRHRIGICPPAIAKDPRWRSASAAAKECDRIARERFDAACPRTRQQVTWHLRQYRRNTFDVSWLEPSRWDDPPSAFEYAARSVAKRPAWWEDANRQAMGFASREDIRRALDRTVTAIGDIGFSNFVEDICSEEMRFGQDSLVGTDAVRLIAKNASPTGPSDFIMVVSSQSTDETGISGLQRCLDEMEAHNSPSFVVIITDSWNGPRFEQQVLSRIQQASERGSQFFFLLVGSPDTSVSRIPLTLEIPAAESSDEPHGRDLRAIQLD